MKKVLTDALNKNQYLRRLELQQVKDMVECMYECTYGHGQYVIQQGEPGNHLFVLAGRTRPLSAAATSGSALGSGQEVVSTASGPRVPGNEGLEVSR